MKGKQDEVVKSSLCSIFIFCRFSNMIAHMSIYVYKDRIFIHGHSIERELKKFIEVEHSEKESLENAKSKWMVAEHTLKNEQNGRTLETQLYRLWHNRFVVCWRKARKIYGDTVKFSLIRFF